MANLCASLQHPIRAEIIDITRRAAVFRVDGLSFFVLMVFL